MARKQSNDKEAMKRAARMILNDEPVSAALREAGYSESTSKLGKAGISQTLWAEIAAQAKEMGALGKKFDPEAVESVIEGRLARNTILGKSDGNEAAKLWGSMKKHQLFQADSMTGVIVLQAPNLAPAGKTLLAADSRDLLPSPILDVESED
jgi:predicted outer membrane protein